MKFFYLLILIFTVSILHSTNNEPSFEKEKKTTLIQARYEYAQQKMDAGNLAMLHQDYLTATKNYYNATEAILQDNLFFTEIRNKILHLLCISITNLISSTSKKSSSSQYQEATSLINFIFQKSSYPASCRELLLLSEKYYTNQLKLLPYSEKIRAYLAEAASNLEQESWEHALVLYKKVLSIQSDNQVAYLGLQLIHEKQEEEKLVMKHTHDDMMNDVDQAWSLPESKSNSSVQASHTSTRENIPLLQKLNGLIIPEIEFYYLPITEAIKELRKKASLADDSDNSANKKGINIILKMNSCDHTESEPLINLCLRNTPLSEVLRYLAQQANLQITIERYAVKLSPFNEEEENQVLEIREFNVPPDFFTPLSQKSKDSLHATNTEASSSLEKESLLSQGITFPKGATAHYFSDHNLLVVRNTVANLNLIDYLIRSATDHLPFQVEIEARFIEIKQNTFQEKGFNWLLGSFPIGKGVNGGGGTVGNQSTYHPDNYPIQQNQIPVGTIPEGPPGAGSVTAGNRLGTSAINVNTLESLLGGYFFPNTGVLALAGVLTNPQFQVVLRALNQKKGTDLLSSPKVTVSSGKKATITVAKDFPYPNDYLPPQVPQNQGGGVNPAIPATPANFKRRNVGVELEVEPVVSIDHKKVDLKLSPQVIEFQGFVNYGNPIFSQAPSFIGMGQGVATASTKQVLLTENTINQPIFSVRQVNTHVVLQNGQTVVLGGLMRDDVQRVKDKTPIIGDIPLVGSLFRSSSEKHIKRNLLIFVTVWFLDPSGKRVVVKSK